MSLPRPVRAFITAVQFLTRVPIKGGVDGPEDDRTLLVDAVGYFPLVGAMIGLATGTAVYATGQIWNPWIAIGLALTVEALLTGGFHEDAVADTCDAFGGGWTREQTLTILKDSRVGSYGALGLILAIGLRWSCLAAIDIEAVILATIAAGTIGRLSIVVAMAMVPPVPKREGLSKDVGERIGIKQIATAIATSLPIVVLIGYLFPREILAAISAATTVTMLFAIYVQNRLGGMVGDCLGTVCALARLATLLAWTAI